MKTIEFTVLDAKRLLGKSKEVDEFIREKFTEEELQTSITDRVKTFEDAFKILTGHTYAEAGFPYDKHRMPHEIARIKLEVVCSVLNEGWVPDLLNEKEFKYIPWFYAESIDDGVGFHSTSAGLVYASSANTSAYASATVGARLCFKTKEIAEYAGKQFIYLYELMLLK